MRCHDAIICTRSEQMFRRRWVHCSAGRSLQAKIPPSPSRNPLVKIVQTMSRCWRATQSELLPTLFETNRKHKRKNIIILLGYKQRQIAEQKHQEVSTSSHMQLMRQYRISVCLSANLRRFEFFLKPATAWSMFQRARIFRGKLILFCACWRGLNLWYFTVRKSQIAQHAHLSLWKTRGRLEVLHKVGCTIRQAVVRETSNFASFCRVTT